MPLTDLINPLKPPYFEPDSSTKTIEQAIQDGDWLGGIHVWLYILQPTPSVVLQVRSRHSRIAPNKLDVAAAGHYDAGEKSLDGLREVREELGIEVASQDCRFWGQRLFVDLDSEGRERKFVMATYIAECKQDVTTMVPQKGELEGVFEVPLEPLLHVLYGQQKELVVLGVDDERKPATYVVKQDAFYHNADNYHLHLLEYIAFKLGVQV